MIVQSISGKDLRIIQAALPEAQKRKLNLDLYRISTFVDETNVDGKQNHLFVVSFVDIRAPWPAKGVGNPGEIPGLEVRLDQDTLKVMGAHYIK